MYYSAEHEDKEIDLGYENEKLVKEWLDEYWIKCCIDNEIRHGEVMEDVAYILKLDDELNVIERKKYNLYCEGYHGDFLEHNTYRL